jgi:hypothetical protein
MDRIRTPTRRKAARGAKVNTPPERAAKNEERRFRAARRAARQHQYEDAALYYKHLGALDWPLPRETWWPNQDMDGEQ